MNRHRGFIQIPILIAIIVGFFALGGSVYMAYEAGQKSLLNTSDSRQTASTTVTLEAATTSGDEKVDNAGNKSRQFQRSASPASTKQNEPAVPIQVQVQPSVSVSAELKIEKCKAQRDQARASLETTLQPMVDSLALKYADQLRTVLMAQYSGTVTAGDFSALIGAQLTKYKGEKYAQIKAEYERTVNNEYAACINMI